MDMMGSPGRWTLGVAMTGALLLGGCTSEGATAPRPTNSAVSVGPQTTPTATTEPSTAATTRTTSPPPSPTVTSPSATSPAVTTESGDLDAGHGITLTLAPGWTVSSITDEDDGRLHTLNHATTGAQLLLVTTDDVDDDTPAELCVEAQDELDDRYERNGAVTRTQGAAHSDNAHTCGLAATNDKGVAIEITVFAAVGAKAAFVTAAVFPSTTPQGVSQETLDQAVREASQMSSELLNDID